MGRHAMPPTTKNLSQINLPAIPDRTVFGDVSYPPGGTCGPRVQVPLQFVIVHSGSVEVHVDRTVRSMNAEQVCLVFPGPTTYFAFDRRRPTHHTWVDLNFSASHRWTPMSRRLPFCLPLTRRMSDVLEAGLNCQARGGQADQRVLAHLAVAFFYAYVDAAANARTDKPLPEPVIKARRHIEKHFARPLDLADIADAANVTDNHIVRLFNKHLGATPVRYLWQVRVHRGAELLRSTGLNISEVAYRVGFSTPYHFSRLVKKQLGQTPRELRRAAWGQ